MAQLMLLATLCIVVLADAYKPPSSCPTELSACDCQTNSVTCSQKGLTLIPEGVAFDLGVTYFYFDRNGLTQIRAGHFENFVDMTYLSLRENKIASIENGSLDRNTKLEQLDLSNNQLTVLPINLFKRMTRLRHVYLSHNRLKRIESSLLMHLTTLEDVRLNNNELTYVGADTFRNSPKLTRLYLEANRLEIPEKDWFAAFNSTVENYEVYLDDNVWSCDCRMRAFYQWGTNHPWFMHHDGEGVSVPQCNFPVRLRGTNLARIPSVDDLRCEAATLTTETNEENEIRATEGQMVKLFCNATGLPLPDVEIRDSDGNLMTSSKGTTVYRISEVTTSNAGLYTCRASGYNKNDVPNSISKPIRIIVSKSAGHVATTIILTLLFLGLGLGVAVWYYKKKWGHRSSYGRLPNNTAYYERSDIEQAANANVESRHIPPGGPPAPNLVTNPYHDDSETEEDEEAVLEFSKDTEFLV